MPRKFFKRIAPDPDKIKSSPYFKWSGSVLQTSDIWHLNKHSVAGAFFIGVFCSFLPIPFQTVLAGALAIAFKRNIALAVGLVFISNPLTMPAMFYFDYWVGSLILDQPVLVSHMEIKELWPWLKENFDSIGVALIVGSLVCGTFFGLLSFWGIHIFWVWQVKRVWNKRKRLRARGITRITYLPPGYSTSVDSQGSNSPS